MDLNYFSGLNILKIHLPLGSIHTYTGYLSLEFRDLMLDELFKGTYDFLYPRYFLRN